MEDKGSKNYIDWEAQWAAHAPHFSEGVVKLDLTALVGAQNPHPPIVYLEPGPGFGDLSHPTTCLVLKMMGTYVRDKYVCDIGCGSGVLSVCALAMGALSVDGIDIDPEALKHAQANAKRNHFQKQTRFYLPQNYRFPKKISEVVLLMNMISSEQQVAWNSLPFLHTIPGIVITSGILITQRESYLRQCIQRGWTLLSEEQEGGWLATAWTKGLMNT